MTENAESRLATPSLPSTRRRGRSLALPSLAPCTSIAALLAATLGLLPGTRAQAATLEPVSDWDADGVPTTVSMYIYVPDNVAVNPPILVLIHYCGGTASAVFGQAQGGGIAQAADQHGFIMVVPQAANADGSGRCWDVGSSASLTRYGGGDTEAIIRMVQYTLTTYQANPDRVYVTGDSSGGMATEALLSLYPDIFEAGSAFAGVPAGCWAAGNPDGSWSGQCAGGQVNHTPEEWGAIVTAMFPDYSGHRPRVQLFHGDNDTTINYANHTEAIKEWSHVLGLSTDPTSTDTVTLGSHQATRQRWENSCGYVVLDAFTSIGGDHGPSDAIFDADYVIPFLGLDRDGDIDPEIEECGVAGTGGSSGTGGAAGTAGAGGSSGGGGSGGAAGTSVSGGFGGVAATGGALDTGGSTSTGGTSGTGGAISTGAAPGTGALPSTGGSAGTGGAIITGGVGGVGGTGGVGGMPQSGGVSAATAGGGTPTGGVAASSGGSGNSGDVTGGSSGIPNASNTGGDAAAGSASDRGSDSGCVCTLPSTPSQSGVTSVPGVALGLAWLMLARRRRRGAGQRSSSAPSITRRS